MPEFERSTTVAGDPDEAFRYLADAKNLPRYVASMTSARPSGSGQLDVAADVQGRHEHGDAAFHADATQRRIEWSGAERRGYRGWLQVSGSNAGTTIVLHLHTESESDSAEIQRVLDETVANIERLLGQQS